jgi:hypothetical protein
MTTTQFEEQASISKAVKPFMICAKLLNKLQSILQVAYEYNLTTEKVLDEMVFICSDKQDNVNYLQGLKRAIIKKEEVLAELRKEVEKQIEELSK